MGYALDVAAKQFADSFVAELRKAKPKRPITHVRFFIPQTAITPWQAFVFSARRAETRSVMDADFSVWCMHEQRAIPTSVDDSDRALARYRKKHGIDAERLQWSDLGLGLLCGLYFRELLSALRDAKPALVAAKVPLARTVRMVAWDEDKIGFDCDELPARYDAQLASSLAELKLSPKAIADLAALCFTDANKQAWLGGLTSARPRRSKK